MGSMVTMLSACSVPPLDGVWLAGDLHVHSSVGSNDTDGNGTVEALGPAMEEAGLDFLFITDHSNAQGSMGCEDVEDCPNQGPEISGVAWPEGVIEGSEISPIASLEGNGGPTGHVGCLPLEGAFVDLEVWIDRPPGEVSGKDAVEQCVAKGGWAIVEHPHAAAPWVEYDWTSEDFDALEVYNGGARFDPWDAESVSEWEARAADGVVPVGGSDCHRWGGTVPDDFLNPPLGWPTTWVRVLDGELPIDALVAGRVVIGEPDVSLRIEASTRRQRAGPGGVIDGPAELLVEGHSEGDVELQLVRIPGEVVASGSDELVYEGQQGLYYARFWPTDPDFTALATGVALTGVIRVR
ncbi:MAG TPA: hypothetical protein QGF58_01105 [Myxococcota bacterium]|nr:hypothetical protein [Myxococcota bacterium]